MEEIDPKRQPQNRPIDGLCSRMFHSGGFVNEEAARWPHHLLEALMRNAYQDLQ